MIEKLTSLFKRKEAEPAVEGLLVNAYCTMLQVPRPEFPHSVVARRDRTDPELAPHLNGFCGYVHSRGDGQMLRDKYHVILHLQRVQQQVSMFVAEDDMPALFAWAAKANALLFLPDGHVRAPDGMVLVNAGDGLAEAGASLPYPEQALARKARIESKLASLGIVVPASLPPLICEKELDLRGADEIHGRAEALLACAVRAESCLAGEPMPGATILQKLPKAALWLTDKEHVYIDLEGPTQHESVQFIWGYEAALVLVWALGLVDDLPYPDKACDAGQVVQALSGKPAVKLRGEGDILEALDMTYRLHWHVRQQRLKNGIEVEGIDASVLMERHRALNWLVRFQHAGWDEVDTPT